MIRPVRLTYPAAPLSAVGESDFELGGVLPDMLNDVPNVLDDLWRAIMFLDMEASY